MVSKECGPLLLLLVTGGVLVLLFVWAASVAVVVVHRLGRSAVAFMPHKS